MNRNAPMASPHDVSWFSFLTHALIWIALVGAGLLLAWFVAVLHDSVERGEQRRLQQQRSAASPMTLPFLSETRTGEVR
ncbi:hypothetical protein [Hydrogenophaga sp. BPS33]|uniref:hypothetical protein n=1 Tax=Hydrogenophaga sp. BPS33 TaxID=2651974 RepID=UPI0013200B7A|nr:hypothetical protein [Hydrogenophaga sp. BPS33]QHE86284.1 hypothetical protein F9K07_15925 [Hydrogenophaga sp. BPS33]